MRQALESRRMPMPLILASASPRRAELLTSAGYEFSVEIAHVDESVLPGEPPDLYVLRVARAKARQVSDRCRESGSAVLGADTTVVAGGEILGKPENAADAVRMLERLAGAVHEVLTGVVIIADGSEKAEVVTTRVHLLPITMDEIEWYVRTGEPEGKAGAYAIQEKGDRFVSSVEGSFLNVVGFPLEDFQRAVDKAGIRTWG